MREVTINERNVTIVGSAITPWIYEQEFPGEDMVAHVASFTDKGEQSHLGAIAKMCWAMARCAVYPREFPDYVSWLEQIGGFDYSDAVLCEAVVFEAMKGCFPGQKAMVSRLEEKLAAKRAGGAPAPERTGDGEAGAPQSD